MLDIHNSHTAVVQPNLKTTATNKIQVFSNADDGSGPIWAFLPNELTSEICEHNNRLSVDSENKN
jgi:hypothetical protein